MRAGNFHIFSVKNQFIGPEEEYKFTFQKETRLNFVYS